MEHSKGFKATLKTSFEPQSIALPANISQSIEKSIKQFEAGQTISLEEFKRKHFNK